MSGWGPPAGAPGYPPGYGAPRPPPARGRGGLIIALVVAVALLFIGAAVLVAALVLVGDDDDDSEVAEEVFLEPIATSRDPFTNPVGQDEAVPSALGSAAGSAVATRTGGEPGLYGGTRQQGSCDKTQLAGFLGEEPAKAAAWARVLGITAAEVGSYIDRLTPVVLRADTRITNHGFVDGRATPTQAVLQAGTAVLVDDRGRPVTKCYCGNPLAPPEPIAQRYTGPRWDGFDEGGLTVVVEHTTVIDSFVLVDLVTGETFSRPVGTTGGDDGPPTPPESTTTTTAPPATTATTEPPATTQPPTTTEATVDGISGTYSYSAAIAEGSNGSCIAYDGTFAVTVSGSGADRTVLFDAGQGNVLEGPLAEDDSFDLEAPLPSGEGRQTLVGSFAPDGTISGTGSVDSGDILCNLTFTGRREG